MSPYWIKGKPFPRVTEIIGARECEATGYITSHMADQPLTSHSITLPGTILHARIENHEREKIGLSGSGLKLDRPHRELLARFYRDHRETKYRDLMDKVNTCFAGYLAFDADYPHEALYLEKRLFSKKWGFGGTVDMVGLFKLKGYTSKGWPLHSSLPAKDYFIPCDHSKPCSCKVEEKVAVICDWKSSSRPQKSHEMQMSAYFYLWEENGLLDRLRARNYHIYFKTLSCLFGEHGLKNTKTPYRVFWYDTDPTGFLTACQHGGNERYLTAGANGKTGLKGRCMFCEKLLSCPDRITWSIENSEVVHPVYLTGNELLLLKMGVNAAIKVLPETVTKRLDAHRLKLKVTALHARAAAKKESVEKTIPEMLADIEKRHSLPISEEQV